jgi:hypothetical protein
MHLRLPEPPPLPLLHVCLSHNPHCTTPRPPTPTPTRPLHSRNAIGFSSPTRYAPPIPPPTRRQVVYIFFLARQRLEARLLALWHEQARQHAQEHEQREDLHHAVNPGRRVIVRRAALNHRRKENLRKHRAQLAHARAESVSRTAHARREDLGWRNERRGVGSEVEEELREDVEGEEMRLCEVAPREAEDAEDYGEHGEAADLDGLAADLVDGEDGEPVAGECAGADEHDLAGRRVAEVQVEVCALVEAHGGEERGGGEAEAVECEIEETRWRSVWRRLGGCGVRDLQPAHRCTKEADRLLLLGVELEDLLQRRSWSLVLCQIATCLGLSDRVDYVALLAIAVFACVH